MITQGRTLLHTQPLLGNKPLQLLLAHARLLLQRHLQIGPDVVLVVEQRPLLPTQQLPVVKFIKVEMLSLLFKTLFNI